MTKNELINRAFQLGQIFLSKKGFKKYEMEEYLMMNKIPERLAHEVIKHIEIDLKLKRKKQAKKRLYYGVTILVLTGLVIVGFYIYAGEWFLFVPGVAIVPGLGLLLAGAWEFLED